MEKLGIFTILLLALVLIGCTDNGELTVVNNSNDDVWFRINHGNEITLEANQDYEKSWELSSNIFGVEEKDVEIDYSGYHVFTSDIEFSIEAGESKKFKIYADGGAITIWNNSNIFYIEEVYISDSDDQYWGNNQISSDIGPGESITWTVSPGFWDIQLVDDWGNVFVAMNEYIELDVTTIFAYDGFKKAAHPAGGKKVEFTPRNNPGEMQIEMK
jgi:hypothetical protein